MNLKKAGWFFISFLVLLTIAADSGIALEFMRMIHLFPMGDKLGHFTLTAYIGLSGSGWIWEQAPSYWPLFYPCRHLYGICHYDYRRMQPDVFGFSAIFPLEIYWLTTWE